MSSPYTCPECGAELTADGLCPACLFQGALYPSPDDEPDMTPNSVEIRPSDVSEPTELCDNRDSEGKSSQSLSEALQTPVTDKPASERANATFDESDPSLDFLGPPANPDHLGTLGSYEITEVIGRGGMGVVLKGHDPKLNRVVAIKVLAPELASNATAHRRFLREAQAAAAVSHDHVVTIHAVDKTDGLPYLVMEYVDGRSLQGRIDRSGSLEVKEILRIGMQTASGLAAAHAQGLIHRDIKPANILLENGVERVKITDFGLARAVDDVGMTQTGTVAGTPQFMSPEQAEGQHVDHRSDLFSLGCVLYAMCTGRPPFRADSTVAVLRRICDDTPRPIRAVNKDIPDWLAAIIDKLLAKNPDERFQSANEVAELLGQCLAHLQQPSIAPLPEIGVADATREKQPRMHIRGDASAANASRSPKHRRWTVAAAVLLIFFGGLGLTEATGITQVVPTVIQIVTGEGTLIVEVDDPAVSVQIDGEELVIKGAGVHEVRVTPGKHQVQAVKGGKAVHQELVTITRGGKQVVKVDVEGALKRVASSKLQQELERVVRAGRGSLSDAERKALKTQGHFLANVLDDPMFKPIIELLAGLPDEMHQRLLHEGYLKWPYASLDEARRAGLDNFFRRIDDQIQEMGFGGGGRFKGKNFPKISYRERILPKSDVGFVVLELPGSGQQAVVFYSQTPGSPMAVPLPIVFSEPRAAKIHDTDEMFTQLSALKNRPYSPLPENLVPARDSEAKTSHLTQPALNPKVIWSVLGEGADISVNTISRSGVEVDEKALRIEAEKTRTVRLYEIPVPEDQPLENCMLTYRAKLRTADLDGKAYLEMWVRAPGHGEFFSKDLAHAVSGTTGWAAYETPFFLKKGERIDLVKLNLVVEGKGTAWMKEVELLKGPLPLTPGEPRGSTPRLSGKGQKHEGATEAQLDPEQIEAAVEAAEEWLKLVDAGKFAEAWKRSTELSRKLLPKDEMAKLSATVRKPLGKVLSRDVISKSYTTSLPRAPDGHYVIIQFKTRFENKQDAVETVTPMLETDGTWRMSWYSIE